MLKLTAVAAVVNVFFFGFGYANANVKQLAAPLQPPVVAAGATRATPAPALNVRRGVRTTTNPAVTTTRHS